MASSRFASSITLSGGTKTNSASLSMNFLMSQGHATLSTLTCSRVIHFMGRLLWTAVPSATFSIVERSFIAPDVLRVYFCRVWNNARSNFMSASLRFGSIGSQSGEALFVGRQVRFQGRGTAMQIEVNDSGAAGRVIARHFSSPLGVRQRLAARDSSPGGCRKPGATPPADGKACGD